MEIMSGDSKNFTKYFSWKELSDLKKLVLVQLGEDKRGYDDVEYHVELLNKPTKPYLKGSRHQGVRWYKHIRNNAGIFDK